jgi:hypothetical protein
MGEERDVYRILMGKPEEKRPLGKPRRRWDQNGSYGDWLGVVEWIHLAQNRDWWRVFVNTVMNLRVLAPGS